MPSSLPAFAVHSAAESDHIVSRGIPGHQSEGCIVGDADSAADTPSGRAVHADEAGQVALPRFIPVALFAASKL